MKYICPSCQTENLHPQTFDVEEYICKSCTRIIQVKSNQAGKAVSKPKNNIALQVGDKGILNGTEYSVINIVVKKYGSSTFWREYALLDTAGNYASLSESDGHWVLMKPLAFPFKDFKSYAEYDGKKYRWFETTPCSLHEATGFFQDKIDFKLSDYKEFVNGTEMISAEKTGNRKEFFAGSHVNRSEIKRAFSVQEMPNYEGIGIVQPFYVNFRQAINILGAAAILISLIQLYIIQTQNNTAVFEQQILFDELKEGDFVSKSFSLSGATAPLEIDLYSPVENSWANVSLNLVNEETNEIVYTSKDIEKYSGVEDGESWSEGSERENLNICGVSSGRYHFVISATRENPFLPIDNVLSSDQKFLLSRDGKGLLTAKNVSTEEMRNFNDIKALEKDTSAFAKQLQASFSGKNIDKTLDKEALKNPGQYDTFVDIKAIWQPASIHNYVVYMIILVVVFLIIFFGRRSFNASKWMASSNSPYS